MIPRVYPSLWCRVAKPLSVFMVAIHTGHKSNHAARLDHSTVCPRSLVLYSDSLWKNMDNTLQTFPCIVRKWNGRKENVKKRQDKSNGLSKVEDTFYQWLQTEARLCSKKIKSKRNKALRISLDSLPDEIHVHSNGNKMLADRKWLKKNYSQLRSNKLIELVWLPWYLKRQLQWHL